MRERSFASRLGLHVAATAAVAAVVATIGPFGTFSALPAADRYLYWMIIIPLNWAQVLLAAAAVSRLPFARGWPGTAVAAAGGAAASVPASVEVWCLEAWLRPGPAPPTVLELWPYVLLLTLALALPVFRLSPGSMRFLARPRPEDAPAPLGPAAPAAPNFLARVPRPLRGAPLCVAAEDHYLRVHTAGGSALILYRMADALADLAGADGLQVHRSFWVAAEAVAGVERSGRRVSLRLTNGLVVPVSRSFLARVRAAGWLARA